MVVTKRHTQGFRPAYTGQCDFVCDIFPSATCGERRSRHNAGYFVATYLHASQKFSCWASLNSCEDKVNAPCEIQRMNARRVGPIRKRKVGENRDSNDLFDGDNIQERSTGASERLTSHMMRLRNRTDAMDSLSQRGR